MSMLEWGGGISAFYRLKIVNETQQIAARACDVPQREIVAGLRRANVAFARQLAMYLCHVVADMSLRDVAAAFGRDRTTVSHACHAIEDRRECPIFDRLIEHLEGDLRGRIRRIMEDAVRRPPPERKCLPFRA